jgi:hypothetical protein
MTNPIARTLSTASASFGMVGMSFALPEITGLAVVALVVSIYFLWVYTNGEQSG